MPDTNRIPTVARVSGDTLIELVYDPVKRETALAVSRFGGLWNIEQEVRIETGEILIPYSATNNLIANDCVLLPSKPEEYGLKSELLADIGTFLHRYVDLSPLFEQIATHYVLLSWVHDAFSELPYLRLRGDYGTGKTRALHTIGSLCYRPFFGSGASTVSPIFHILNDFGGTLVLDEADLPYSDARAGLVKILNNGTAKGMPVLRTVQNRHKELNPYAFKVYGPKLIASREPFQDRALESRFFTEETGTRPLRADIPVHLPHGMKDEALALRNRLLHFRFCEFFRMKTDPTVLVEGIEPRMNQSAFALLSLVDDAALRAEIQQWLRDQDATSRSAKREAPEGLLVAAVVAAAGMRANGAVPVGEITRLFNETNAAQWGAVSYRGMGAMLRDRLGLSTRKSNGVYVVPESERVKLPNLARRWGIEIA